MIFFALRLYLSTFPVSDPAPDPGGAVSPLRPEGRSSQLDG